MKHHIQKHYEEVRRIFFPKWDRQKNWSLQVVQDLDGAHGRCDTPEKRIRLTTGLNGDKLTVLIIHEIAHAVVSGGHGKKWQARMERAAMTAEELGRMELAGLLQKDIAAYDDPLARVTAAGVYSEIADAVVDDPDATFFQVVDYLRRDYGFSRKEFLGRFRRARNVFDREKQEEEKRAKARAALLRQLAESRTLIEKDESDHE